MRGVGRPASSAMFVFTVVCDAMCSAQSKRESALAWCLNSRGNPDEVIGIPLLTPCCGFRSVESGFTNKHKENNPRSTQGIYSLHMRSRHVVRMYIGPEIMPRNGITNYNN